MGAPWNNWFHCICSTYGSWLPGDERGFRSWQHRLHVEGDYRHPPREGEHEAILHRSRSQMQRPAVVLTIEQRKVVCEAVADRLRALEVEFVDLCVSAMHMHLLARFRRLDGSYSSSIPRLPPQSALADGRDPLPRHVVGLLKKHAALTVRRQFPAAHDGGIWAQRGKLEPVHDRAHQLQIVAYIRRHSSQGAIVWSTLQAPK